jgi:hypothetical protein
MTERKLASNRRLLLTAGSRYDTGCESAIASSSRPNGGLFLPILRSSLVKAL